MRAVETGEFSDTLGEGSSGHGESRLVTFDAVESVPGKVSEAWVFKGTHMPVQTVFANLEAGAKIDDLVEWFDGLEPEQVKAVIGFVVRSLDKDPTFSQGAEANIG